MLGQSGPLWNINRDTRREIIVALNGVRARVRYSLNGSLDQQATITGIIHTHENELTVFHVQRDQTEPDAKTRKYTPVIYARVIDIQAAPTIATTVPKSPMFRRQGEDACQNCQGINQPLYRWGKPHHCGKCSCCRDWPFPNKWEGEDDSTPPPAA